MRIAVVGTGYVGLVSGACFAELGHTVTCIDSAEHKIAALREGVMPIYEPGLDELVASGVRAGRLAFTTEIGPAVAQADAVFIAVGTPTLPGDGHADLSHVRAAAVSIARSLQEFTVVVTKSTVPVGTSDEILRILRETNPDADVAMASNPEFLREGSAIEDFKHPDRVLIGVEDVRAREVMEAVYRPMQAEQVPILFVSRRTAELTKYASNAFLAMKVTFINEIADLCEKTGVDVQDLARGIGLDTRIGPKFLNAGPGYGGSCFPKDTLALVKTARDHGAPVRLVETTVAINDERKRAMAERIIAACGGSVAGKTIGLLGLTFKPNTDDMRDAPSIVIAQTLREAGATLRVFDPAGMDIAQPLIPEATYCGDGYEVAEGADCLALVTEWNEFRALDVRRLRAAMRGDAFVDMRNLYRAHDMRAAGFRYSGIGRAVS
ncbi:MAG: UDP-glucose/GDP-mannose dehydrogenase family protein [Rhizobiaceae bacterium]